MRLITLLFAFSMVASASAAPTDDRQAAVWAAKELTFDYVGFTSWYSCDGLRDKVSQALVLLGARRDLAVTSFRCTKPNGPELFPGVKIQVSTLKPVTGGVQDGAIQAQWKRVNLGGLNKLTPGDCELAEQIRDQILPLFTTRNLKAQINCVPHQESAGNIQLAVDVLVPAKD